MIRNDVETVCELKKYFEALLKNSPLHNLFRLLEFLEWKNRSEPHRSVMKCPKRDDSRPIFLIGHARSGTTTFQRLLSDAFGYNASFEPIGFNHSDCENDLFSQVTALFRGAPESFDLPLYQLGGGSIHALHTLDNDEMKHHLSGLLERLLAHLFSHYGRNVVIKEVSMTNNLTALKNVSNKMGIEPIFILLKCNPLITLHSFYRLGGLIDCNNVTNMRVDELYEYDRITYKSLSFAPEMYNIECKNRYEKLLWSIIMDQKYMQFYASENPSNTLIADFGKAKTAIAEAANKFQLEKRGEGSIHFEDLKRFQKDNFFINEVKCKVNPLFFRIIEEDLGWTVETAPNKNINYKQLITFLRLKILSMINN